ncbi:MAG: tetratricopeptide repeat protein [Spirochaetales bacterium]
MNTKKLNLNKDEWNKKWEKDPPIKTRLEKPTWEKSTYTRGNSNGMTNEFNANKTSGKNATTGNGTFVSRRAAAGTDATANNAPSLTGSSVSDKPKSSFTNFSAGERVGGFTSSADNNPPGNDGGNGNGRGTGGDNKNNRKKTILIILLIAVAILGGTLGLSLLVRNCRSGTSVVVSGTGAGSQERENMLLLAQRYMDRGEYDRAMDLLDQLLIQNSNDEQALAMSDEILALKANENAANVTRPQSDPLTIDMSGFENAVDRLAQENAATLEAVRQSQMELAVAEEKRIQDETENERIRQEERERQEEQRRIQEEELAQQNAALKEVIDKINDEVATGKALLLSGRYEDALNNFATAASLLPDGQDDFSGSKLSEIADLLQMTSETEPNEQSKTLLQDAAVTYAEKALDYLPNDANSHYILGKQAAESKDYAQALESLTAATKEDSTNSLYFYELGKIQYLTGKYAEARTAFETSGNLNPTFYQAWFNAHLAYTKLGRTDDAIAALRKAVAANTGYVNGWLQLARLQNQRGDYDGAIASYEKLLQLDSTNLNGLLELGIIYLNGGNNAQAEQSFRRAISYAANDAKTNYNLSIALYAQGKLSEAEDYALKAVENDSKNATYLYNYGLILDTLGNFDSAVNFYVATLQVEPNHIKANINLGKLYVEAGDPDGALGFLTAAVNADPTGFEAVNNLAGAYLAKQDYENAIKYFLDALKIERNNETAKINLASAYASSEQYDNAKTLYTEVLQYNPNNLEVYLALARVYIALHDSTNAELTLTTLKAKDPTYKSSEVADLMATI